MNHQQVQAAFTKYRNYPEIWNFVNWPAIQRDPDTIRCEIAFLNDLILSLPRLEDCHGFAMTMNAIMRVSPVKLTEDLRHIEAGQRTWEKSEVAVKLDALFERYNREERERDERFDQTIQDMLVMSHLLDPRRDWSLAREYGERLAARRETDLVGNSMNAEQNKLLKLLTMPNDGLLPRTGDAGMNDSVALWFEKVRVLVEKEMSEWTRDPVNRGQVAVVFRFLFG